MGKKRTWKGQHIFLYIAYCAILIIWNTGCAVFQPVMSRIELGEAEKFLELGDYVSAMEMNERAASNAYSFQMDDVLYQRGLILVQPRNPKRDYEQAEESFLKLVEEYPASPLRKDAMAWITVIKETEKHEVKIQNTQLEISTLRKELKEKTQQLDKAQGRLKEKDQELVTLQNQLQKLQSELKELRGQIEKLKEIDLGIDTIKRETLPQ